MSQHRAWLDAYAGRRVVVTGAGGFIGSRLVEALRGTPCEIVRLVRTTNEAPGPVVDAGTHDLHGDLTSVECWTKALAGANFVFHLAAQTSAAVSESDPAADFESNVLPVRRLIEACARSGTAPCVVLAGTATQCGIPRQLPVDETHPDRPCTVYDRHKLMAERSLEEAGATGVLRGTCLRLANVYGPGPAAGRRDRGILNRMIARAMQGQEVTIHGEGHELRDYIHVDDVVDALIAAGASIDALNGSHFVIGTGQGCTIAEAFMLVAERAGQRLGRKVRVSHVTPAQPALPIEARHFVADSSRFEGLTGWRARHRLAQGIDLTLDSYACVS